MSRRLETERAVVEGALPTIADLNSCNRMLVEAGRPDLTITERVGLLQISSPDKVATKLSNFGFKFQLGHYANIPITEDSLLRLKEQPDYLDELLGDPLTQALTHAGKPAFQRMLTLFPEFTIQLVLAAQAEEGEWQKLLAPDLFTAYQLMCQLVDKQDPRVVINGEVDKLYFYR